MELRLAEPSDWFRIREIAADSFRNSYSLSPQDIEILLDEVFSEAALTDRFEDPDVVVLVAEDEIRDGGMGVHGFVDAVGGEVPTMRWLHVAPTARGRGIATALFERTRDELADDGTQLQATMLADAVEGADFLTGFGLERTDSDRVEYGDEEYMLDVFRTDGRPDDPNEPTVDVPETVTVDGEKRHVDRDDQIPGRDAPFFSLYTDRGETEAFGYLCSQCGSVDVSADGLDRLACNECGNLHKAEEWDGSFL